jgi:MFS family permease
MTIDGSPVALRAMNDQALVAERKKQRWFITVFFFISGILSASWSSRIPDIQQKLQLSNAALGTVLFALPAGLVVGLSFAGWAVASFGVKRMLLMGSILLSIILFMAGTAATPFLLMLALFFFGVCRTVLNLSANTGSLDVQRLYERPIVSTFHGIWSLACFAAAGIATVVIIQNVSPLWHFLGIGVIVVIMTVVFAGHKFLPHKAAEQRPFFVMPDRYLFLLGLMALSAMLCEGAIFDWGVNYFEKVVKPDKGLVTAGYISFITTMAIGRLLGDRAVHAFGIYRVLVVCGVLMAAGFLLAALAPYLVTSLLGFALVGLGDSILVPMIYVLASKNKKMSANYALASVTLIGYAGFIIGPLLIGNISEYIGMPAAFLLLSVASLGIIFLSLKVKKFGY